MDAICEFADQTLSKVFVIFLRIVQGVLKSCQSLNI